MTLATAMLLLAATTGSPHNYRTYVNETYGSGIGWAGKLTVAFLDSHDIRGTWRSESGDPALVTVSGRQDGNTLVFDIGTRLHVTATLLPDGSIKGSAVSEESDKPLTFTATPESGP